MVTLIMARGSRHRSPPTGQLCPWLCGT